MTLTKTQRTELFNMFGGRCAYCGHALPVKGWHADHIEPILRDSIVVRNPKTRNYEYRSTGTCFRPENDHKDNLFPACAKCNIDKGPGNIENFRAGLAYKVKALRKNNASFRHLERFNLVAVHESPIVFYFEELAREETLRQAHAAEVFAEVVSA